MLKKSALKRMSTQLTSIVQHLHNGNHDHRRAVAKREAPTLQRWRDLLDRYCSETAAEWRLTRERWTGVVDTAIPTWSHEDAARTRFWRTVAVLAFLFEATFAASIARFWLSVPIWLVAPVAVGLAGLFTWFCEARWTANSDEAMPEVEYRRAKKTITGLISLVLLAIAFFFATRMLFVAALVLVGVQGALSILLPLIAGGAFYIAKLTGFSNTLVERHREAEAVLLRVQAALADANSLLVDPQNPRSLAKSTETVAEPHEMNARRCVALLAILSVTWLATPSHLSAATAQTSTRAANAVSRRLDVWIDVSGSLDPRELSRVISVMNKSAQWMGGFQEIALFGFADAHDVLSGPLAILPIPQRSAFTCSESIDGLARYLLAAQRDREKQCAARERAESEKFGKQLTVLLGLFRRTISSLISDRNGATKTCLYQVISRAQTAPENKMSLVITDGAQFRCPGTIPIRSQRQGARTILIIVPTRARDDRAIADTAERLVSLRRIFPSVELHASYEIDEDVALARILSRR
jgi:hypothetical protein